MQLDKIRNWLKNNLDEERYRHVLGVEQSARELAIMFNEDEEKAALGGLLHDTAKSIKNSELLNIIDENNLPVSEEEKNSVKTLHSPVGAFMAENLFGIKDEEILNSIRFHTVGRINMSMIEKIVFLADKIEAETRDIAFRNKVLNEVKEKNNIDAGILICYGATIKSLVDRKLYINNQTIEVWNFLINSLK
ncbi:MAG: bis(5'-nucleosyl)-tetraphosphatase (symmetrical) YqeK [bacterium]